jgi:hypothetical protein
VASGWMSLGSQPGEAEVDGRSKVGDAAAGKEVGVAAGVCVEDIASGVDVGPACDGVAMPPSGAAGPLDDPTAQDTTSSAVRATKVIHLMALASLS